MTDTRRRPVPALFGLAFALLALLNASGARAASSYFEAWDIGNGSGTDAVAHGGPQQHVNRIQNDYIGYSTLQLVEFSSSPAPYVTAMSSSWGSGAQPLSLGTMSYRIDLSGPANAWIPLHFEGRFQLGAVGAGLDMTNQAYGNAETAFISLGAHGVNPFMQFHCDIEGCKVQTNISVVWAFESTTSLKGTFADTVGIETDASGHASTYVQLQALSMASWKGGLATTTTTAFIDPAFSIAPDWLAAHPETTLTLPEGVGNAVAAVPEPGSWALLSAGMALLAWRRRREPAFVPFA
jgi:hypothetical protein